MPVIADLDHDGVSDLIVTFLVDEPGAPLGLACWVDALSGRTGRPLWRVPLERIPRPDLAQAAALLSMQGTPTVGVLSDYEWRGYDPATAAQWKSRYHLGFLPVRPPLYDDLNGDGQPELLLVREPGHYPARGLSIRALGPPWRPLWEVNVGGLSRNPSAPLNPRDPWPTVVDLDPNDGERNVLIPDDTTRGVRALHGTTGEPRWQRLLSNGEDEAAGTNTPAPVSIDGPDLDGDGIREVFTASFFWDQARGSTSLLGDRDVTGLYVDALSGRDGRSLWWSRQPVDRVFPIHAHLQWWQDAPDGGPLLVVSVGHSNTPLARDAGAEVFLLAAETGALKRPIQGLAWPRLADFNGDGRADLWGLVGGRVCVLPGERPAAPGPRPEPPHVAVRLDGAARPDPRLWRPLPWVPAFPIPLTFVPVIAVLGLLVWVIPLRLLRRGVRTAPKGRRMPGIALGLALAVAIVVGTYLALPPDRIQRLFEGVELYQILLALAVILPIVVISGWVVWRRGVGVPLHFPVRLSPVLWICLAIAIVEAAYVTAVISERPTGPRPGLIGLLVMAALGVPVVVLVDAFGGALLRRDWRRLEWLVGLVLVFALAIVATTLALDLPRKSPAEHYLWERWYTVLYPALYLTGLSLLVFRGVTSLVRRAARWIDARPVRSKKKLDDLAEL